MQVLALYEHFVTMRFFKLVLFYRVRVDRAEHRDFAFQRRYRLRCLVDIKVFYSIRQTAFIIERVRLFYAQAQIFEVGVDFANFQLAFITLVALLGKRFLQARLFFFERRLTGVDFFFFFGSFSSFR